MRCHQIFSLKLLALRAMPGQRCKVARSLSKGDETQLLVSCLTALRTFLDCDADKLFRGQSAMEHPDGGNDPLWLCKKRNFGVAILESH